MKRQQLEQAVKKYKSGDINAFDTIYDCTYKVVYYVIFSVVNNRAVAEDIMQDTYLKVCRNINSYQADNFMSWITMIAKNTAINEYNKRKREVVVDISDYQDNFSTTMGKEDSMGLMDLAKDLLNEQDYKIILMCVVAGYKRKEVAKMMNLPISTVSYRYKISLQALEEKLKKGGYGV